MKPEALPKWLANRGDGEVSLPEKESSGEAGQLSENGDRDAAGQPNQPEDLQPLLEYKTISEEELFS